MQYLPLAWYFCSFSDLAGISSSVKTLEGRGVLFIFFASRVAPIRSLLQTYEADRASSRILILQKRKELPSKLNDFLKLAWLNGDATQVILYSAAFPHLPSCLPEQKRHPRCYLSCFGDNGDLIFHYLCSRGK